MLDLRDRAQASATPLKGNMPGGVVTPPLDFLL
jgi:hypothetical protein